MALLQRANSAATMLPSPRTTPRHDFREGSIVEERDRNGHLVARYRCGVLLGRGGFAKCFDFVDLETNQSLACKVIDRQSLIKSKTLSKLHSEIAIHRRMKHRNIVNFIKTFQDEHFVYILLEKCTNQTLMEVAKTRKRFSVPETQYLMLQTISAMDYMHRNNVIHRDLKLGNIMMDGDMNVKVGDFGLAAELQFDGERKRTICGTPNYIAPEILEGSRDGHSFEADIWSLGVILYTFLVGEPPFQTADVKTTYSRIKQCRFEFPRGMEVNEAGKQLVYRILQSRPDRRPTLLEIRADPFFRDPAPPTSAPLSLFPDSQRRARERDAMLYPGTSSAPASARGYGSSGAPAAAAAAMMQAAPMQAAGARDVLRRVSENVGPTSAQGCPPAAAAGACAAPAGLAAAVQRREEIFARLPVPALDLGGGHGGASARPRSGSVPVMPTQHARDALAGGWCAPSSRGSPSKPTTVAAPAPAAAAPAIRTATAPAPVSAAAPTQAAAPADDDDEQQLHAAHDELHRTLIAAAPPVAAAEEACPAPTVWVTDYADFSSKYGLAYRLNTGHTGVHFNDSTKMVWEPITSRVEYYARVKETINGVVHAQDSRSGFVMDAFPESLNKKVTLIKYFKTYLGKGKGDVVACCPYRVMSPVLLTEPNMVSDMIYVKRWMLTAQAMIFRLSNRTIQVCFLDGTEIILSSESKIVTFTDTAGKRVTLPLSAASSHSSELASRLRFTKDILSTLISNREI